jgi:hypothetical protein
MEILREIIKENLLVFFLFVCSKFKINNMLKNSIIFCYNFIDKECYMEYNFYIIQKYVF